MEHASFGCAAQIQLPPIRRSIRLLSRAIRATRILVGNRRRFVVNHSTRWGIPSIKQCWLCAVDADGSKEIDGFSSIKHQLFPRSSAERIKPCSSRMRTQFQGCRLTRHRIRHCPQISQLVAVDNSSAATKIGRVPPVRPDDSHPRATAGIHSPDRGASMRATVYEHIKYALRTMDRVSVWAYLSASSRLTQQIHPLPPNAFFVSRDARRARWKFIGLCIALGILSTYSIPWLTRHG